MIIAFTGHRPEKIPDTMWVRRKIKGVLRLAKPDKVITGCAAGTDLIAAHQAYKLGLPYVAAKPWGNHKGRMGGSSGFSEADAVVYDQVMEHASEIVNVTGEEEFPGNWAYFKRNEWMVDQIDEQGYLVAIWDGSNSGTSHCVNYALKKGVHVYRIDPVTGRTDWFEQTVQQ